MKRILCGCLLAVGFSFVPGCGGGDKPQVIDTTEEQRAAAIADAEEYEKQMEAGFENEQGSGR